MFIGHQGIAFAAKKAAPRVSLGTMVLAAMWLDVIWPVLVLLGIETVEIKPGITKVTPFDFTSYPYSHSLLFACLWGIAFGGIYWLARRDRRGAIVLGLLVVSHWFLDVLMHRPDLPLYPGSARYGFDLWDSWPATLIAEFVAFGGGVALYLRATKAVDRTGRYALAGLVVFLIVIYASSLVGPPPDSPLQIGLLGLTSLLIPLWAWWADRHRVPRT
jgi:membrane-bound metal-dependent hydrolase YbcI (DUF457 family)